MMRYLAVDTSGATHFPTWAIVVFAVFVAVILLSWAFHDITKDR